MQAKDDRVTWVTQMLTRIREIKMSGVEHLYARRIRAARHSEVAALQVKKYLDALCVYFWAATSLLFSLFTFGAFALSGKPLTPQVAFTSLALFNVLIGPLNSFPWVVNGVMEAIVSLSRLETFMGAREIDPPLNLLRHEEEEEQGGASRPDPDSGVSETATSVADRAASIGLVSDPIIAVEVRGGVFTWSESSDLSSGPSTSGQPARAPPAVSRLSLRVPRVRPPSFFIFPPSLYSISTLHKHLTRISITPLHSHIREPYVSSQGPQARANPPSSLP